MGHCSLKVRYLSSRDIWCWDLLAFWGELKYLLYNNEVRAPEDGSINIWNMLVSPYSTIKMMHGPIHIRFTKRVLSFSLHLLSENFVTLARYQRGIIVTVHWSSCRVDAVLVTFWCNFNFLNRFFLKKSTNIKCHNSDVRHPRCVSYNRKELRVEYAQSNTTTVVFDCAYSTR